MPTEEEVIVDISPRTPSTESSVETSPGINWPTMRIFIPRQFSWFIILVLSLAISLGLFLQLSTLKYSYKTYQLTVGHGSLAGGWICVYVPEGTALNKPFPDYATGKDNYTFYEPNQFVLGHGTWLEGWQDPIRLTTS